MNRITAWIRKTEWPIVVVTAVAVLVLSAIAIYYGFGLDRTRELNRKLELLIERYDNLQRHLERVEDDLEAAEELLQATGGGAERPVEAVPSQPGVFVLPFAETDYIGPSSPFGIRNSPILNVEMHHEGVDLMGIWRAQIASVADGVVVEHWPPPGERTPTGGLYQGHPIFGGYIIIEHPDLDAVSKYAHLHSTRVREGQQVNAGEVIGRQGATGKAVGAHLHLGLEIAGETVNPLLYLPWEDSWKTE